MGDSKRRKDTMGEKYGQPEPIASWLTFINKRQAEQFVKWSTRGAWVGIVGLVSLWVIVRFIGPWAGWWEVQ